MIFIANTTTVYKVYKGTKGVQEYIGFTRVNKVYKGN